MYFNARRTKVLLIVASIGLIVTNIAVIAFYHYYSVADLEAVNRAEEHGFDPSQLLPNYVLFWISATASLLAVLFMDAVVAVWLFLTWRDRRSLAGRRNKITSSTGGAIQPHA